ncbi:hypothetical protein EJB05_14760 [Eragrostis curvula]|uniref:SGNH hydrolase-type esterase domain-containing protein n=1 Tax=Eragrostis curvula TaxID=38414 RepID=A0A5J9W017_9POAL|nr:hypothetical protein EJB05_14760 [Eragrostis curvula]
MKIVPLALCLFLALAGGGDVVEAGRRSRHRRPDYKLLVLGDSYVDAGNLPRSADRSLTSRGWYWPYGISDGNRPSGRFSDGMVQSDFVARILGLDESPPAYSTLGPKDDVDLAVGGSGVLMGTPTLGQQVDQLRSLMMAMGRGVTDEIRSVVKRLLDDVGVSKVVVNTMPPMGCVPWESARNNHTRCESRGNMMSDVHNTALRQKLAEFKQDQVLLLDLNSAFNAFVQDGAADTTFTSRLQECCVAWQRSGGFCGQVDQWGRQQYTLCPNPDQHFFWDYMHPTKAAWKAVMDILQDPLKEFLLNDAN